MSEPSLVITQGPAAGSQWIGVDAEALASLPADRGRVADLLSVMADVAAVGALGGFCGARFSPAVSTMRLLTSEARPEVQLSWSFECVNVDAGALTVVKNVLQRLHVRELPLRAAALSVSTDLLEDPPADGLPGQYQPLPFGFDLDLTGDAAELAIEFAKEEASQAIEQVVERVGAWFCLANAGGYASRSYPPQLSRIYLADEPRLGPQGISFLFSSLLLDGDAWNGLCNILHRAHYEVAALQSVNIA